MTTAVVAGLLQYFGRVDLPLHGGTKKDVEADLEIIHSVAQAAHCAAQGKIGSGFDVSCAVYGSQRYVRFSPSVLSSAQVLSLNCYYLWLITVFLRLIHFRLFVLFKKFLSHHPISTG